MDKTLLITELNFKAVRSSGPGGQHVNKTSSKVEVHFNVINTNALSMAEIVRLSEKLKNRISSDGILVLSCGESRSQHRNKAIVIERMLHLIAESLKVKKKRKKTKPSRAAVEKRLRSKKNKALKKTNRKRPSLD
jgi:ribosome-associated protein